MRGRFYFAAAALLVGILASLALVGLVVARGSDAPAPGVAASFGATEDWSVLLSLRATGGVPVGGEPTVTFGVRPGCTDLFEFGCDVPRNTLLSAQLEAFFDNPGGPSGGLTPAPFDDKLLGVSHIPPGDGTATSKSWPLLVRLGVAQGQAVAAGNYNIILTWTKTAIDAIPNTPEPRKVELLDSGIPVINFRTGADLGGGWTCTDGGTTVTCERGVTVSAGDAATGVTLPFTIQVAEVAPSANPVVSAGTNQTIAEGGTVSLAPATFTDEEANETHTATINWGDGSSDPGVVTEAGGVGTVAGSHTYTDDDILTGSPYTVTVLVVDSNNGIGSDTFQVTVNNVAPVVEAGANQQIAEGGSVILDPATFTDAGVVDTHTATINWGDATPPESGVVTAGTVGGSHTYNDDTGSPFTVTVTVTDDDHATAGNGQGSDTFIVTVTNENPVVDAGLPQTLNEGQSVFLSGSFTDASPDDTHTATIDWDDGTPPTPGTISGSSVFASHEYADNRPANAAYTVTVTDDDDGSGSDTVGVTILNVAPVVEAGNNQTIQQADPAVLEATFTDAGTLDTHTATIDWGDEIPPAPEFGTVQSPAPAPSRAPIPTQRTGSTW